MHILMLAPQFPFPTDSGSRIRVAQCLKILAQNNRVTFISINTNTAVDANESPTAEIPNVEFINFKKPLPSKGITLLKSLTSARPYAAQRFWNRGFKELVDASLAEKKFDIIWIHCPWMAPYIEGHDFENETVVMDEQNNYMLYNASFSTSSNLLLRFLSRISARKLKRFLVRVYEPFTHHVSVSSVDLEDTKTWLPTRTKLLLGPNGVDTDYFRSEQPQTQSGSTILFCGSLDVTMNQDAVLFFASEVLPAVLSKIPDVQFIICGKQPPERIKRLACSSISVTGTVADVREYYARATLCVAPFRYGGGTKLKVLEALATKTPMISTPKGCQGIDVEDGKNILIVESPQRFAQCVIEVLSDPLLRTKLSENGYRLAQEYSWKNIYSRLEQKIWKDHD